MTSLILQIQYEPLSHKSQSSKYKSITQAISTIYKEEGLKAFWKGHLTGQILSSTYAFVQFSTFEFLTKYAFKYSPQTYENSNFKAITHFISGGLAACVSTVVNQPIDNIKTRLVAQGVNKVSIA